MDTILAVSLKVAYARRRGFVGFQTAGLRRVAAAACRGPGSTLTSRNVLDVGDRAPGADIDGRSRNALNAGRAPTRTR